MIKGVGCDILEINRLEKPVDNSKFMTDYYTEREISYISSKKNRAETAAALFCAKEAVAKALGTGFSGFSPMDIEIIHDDRGKPEAILYNRAKDTADKNGVLRLHLSLTHCREYAAAFVTAEGDDNV